MGLAGPPGAGKSTVAREVVHRINSLWSDITLKNGLNETNGEVATVLPMDGFHLYRSQLDQMEVGFHFLSKKHIAKITSYICKL